MNILVCIKQVPGSNNVEVDAQTGVLKRSGVPSKMNPYDLYSLEVALTMREKFGGTVKCITMGPPQAKAIIEEAICMGVDSGVVLSDRKFAGADVLSTSHTLSQGIKILGHFDLILCGKQTTDGDTAQVGASIAENLSIPNLSNVISIDDVKDGKLFVTSSLDTKNIKESIKMPCLISVESDVNTPRLPSFKVKQNIDESRIKFLSFADFIDQDEKHYGLSGSATQVERIFPPEKNLNKATLVGTTDEQATQLFDLIVKTKII